MPAEKRAEVKAKAEQAKQQFPMIKGMLAAQAGNDPDAKDMIDTMENMMNVSSEALDLADKADAAKAAGDKAKQDEADKALKACAEKMIELQKKGMALSAKLQAKKAAAPAGQPE